MRKLVLGAVPAAAAVLPAAPASAQCIQVEGIDRCVPLCPPPLDRLGECTM